MSSMQWIFWNRILWSIARWTTLSLSTPMYFVYHKYNNWSVRVWNWRRHWYWLTFKKCKSLLRHYVWYRLRHHSALHREQTQRIATFTSKWRNSTWGSQALCFSYSSLLIASDTLRGSSSTVFVYELMTLKAEWTCSSFPARTSYLCPFLHYINIAQS
jgi:hypothetical protein